MLSITAQKDSARYIKSDIIDKVLLRDLPSIYGIADVQELNALFTTIAYNTGNEISLESFHNHQAFPKAPLKIFNLFRGGIFNQNSSPC
ncbi:hypothetical protein BSPWISOXPB_9066 [uncultured Gammaproteobacteria bacterium]|nr:hypothetical protein BSPWISOXPB_9066 [uncultured Gammaproteobacteria bacterium]